MAQPAAPAVRTAAGWALLTAVSTSLAPLTVHLFAADINPFWFNAAMMAVMAAVLAAGIVMWDGSLRTVQQAAATIGPLLRAGHRGQIAVAGLAVSASGFGLFVLSSHHVGTVVAAVLYQLWAISAAGLLAVRGGDVRRRLDWPTVGLMTAAVAVTAVVVSTQAPPGGGDGVWWVGVAAGAAAGILSGAVVYTTVVVADEARAAQQNGDSAGSTEMMLMTAALTIAIGCGAVVAALTALTGAGGGGGLNARSATAAAALGVCMAVGAVATRLAYVRSAGLGIFALMGLDPVFAIVWLALAGAGIRNVAAFVVGVAALMVVNTTIQTRDRSTSQPQTETSQRTQR